MRARTAIALLAFLCVAACGGTQLKFAEGNIEDPEAFLEKVERTWQQDLAGRNVAVHEEARCYFARDDNSEELEEIVFCGPVRHALTGAEPSNEPEPDSERKARQGAWDTYDFSITSAEDSLVVSDPVLDVLGIDLPAGRELLRPDDLEPPENAASFAKRKVPTTGSGFVTTTEEQVRLGEAATPEAGTVVTPLTTVSVDRAGSVQTVTGDEGERAPARGASFRALTLSFTRGPYATAYDDAENDEGSNFVDADTQFFVDHNGDRTPLFEDGIPDRSVTVIASVPDGGDTDLVISAAGEEQTISFTSGERSSDNAAAFYDEVEGTDLDEEYPATEASRGDFTVSHAVHFDEATLTPFHPLVGWAEDGRVWLAVDSSETQLRWEDSSYLVTLDRSASAAVRVGDETVEDASESVEYEDFGVFETLSFVFGVPEGETSFDFSYQPTVSFRHPDGAASPPSGRVQLDPVEFGIDASGQ